jgi:two-component system, NtrC family, nitrogen regulation sensor histidine kinase NtrY
VTLAARLLLAFGFVAMLLTAVGGYAVRRFARANVEAGFDAQIDAATHTVGEDVRREAEGLARVFATLCAKDIQVDKAQIALTKAKGENLRELGSRIEAFYFVPDEAIALQLQDLVLVAGDGTVLGATDKGRIGTRDARLAALIQQPSGKPRLRAPGHDAALEVHCARSDYGVTIGLVGARRIDTILSDIAEATRVDLKAVDPGAPVPSGDDDVVVRAVDLPAASGLKVVASVSRAPLKQALAELDQSIALIGGAAILVSIVLAIALAQNLSRPIEALAHETREVVSGEPKRVRGRGGREIEALAEAFNKTIDELTAMRRRVAATERIAARREVARQIAHEIKNPLAPIRAAVETLRRLRMRDDPAFDDYFEEATSTVLGEVHRIANIVTEFTRFNRMPPPNPEPIDLIQVARGVVTLHASPPDGAEAHALARVELVSDPIPMVSADRDQMVQVLTNLIQNGLDAAEAVRPDPRVVVTIGPLPEGKVRVIVRDNGPGVPEGFLPKLFEPYATTKAKGTGLGLAIVQRIVFEHGGEIVYRKAAKAGAVFEITLPVAGPPLLERPPSLEATGRPPPEGG